VPDRALRQLEQTMTLIPRTTFAAFWLLVVLSTVAVAGTERLDLSGPAAPPVRDYGQAKTWRNSMPEQSRASDAPRLDTDDHLTAEDNPSSATAPADPNSPEGLVRNAITLMSASGPHAEADYQGALRALARQPAAAVAAVSEMYRATAEDHYITRWAHVQLLSDLRDKAALDLFQNVLATPIPPEKAPGMVTYSTVGEEVMIRTTAIEGITRLAAAGDRRARDLLRKYAQHEVFSIKRAAVQGYLEAAGPDARDDLRKVLREQDHFILDLRRTDVHNVPQPRVERPSSRKDEPPPARLAPPTIRK
jgi:hypothetical protein